MPVQLTKKMWKRLPETFRPFLALSSHTVSGLMKARKGQNCLRQDTPAHSKATEDSKMKGEKGDQIGRIFACCVIVLFGIF
jgi:hypothetical protein